MDSKQTSKFHYPADISLSKSPLLEAWLEIRWKLTPSTIEGFETDSYYPMALGIFYNSVKADFGSHIELPAGKTPEFMIPYFVQHQFRPTTDAWPLLQLGPGIATVNFTTPYSWHDFKDKALYLRQKLINAYDGNELKTQALNLRYRNGIPFQFSNSDLLAFLRDNLNLSISMPVDLPSFIAEKQFPSDYTMIMNYPLSKPNGKGQIQVGTAKNKISQEELLIWEIQVTSVNDQAPDIKNADNFDHWLDDAHAVIHEWFFSLVQGKLFDQFTKGE